MNYKGHSRVQPIIMYVFFLNLNLNFAPKFRKNLNCWRQIQIAVWFGVRFNLTAEAEKSGGGFVQIRRRFCPCKEAVLVKYELQRSL